jgi:flagellar hook-length control protein FliK
MNNTKNSLFLASLVLAGTLCFLTVSAQDQNQNQEQERNQQQNNQAQNKNQNHKNNNNDENDDNSLNGESHRNAVSTFVQKLLDVADREGGIGNEVKAVAAEQEKNKDKIANAIDIVKNRNPLKTFLIGADYKNIGELRSEMVTTENHINQLNNLLGKTTSSGDQAILQSQITTLQQEKTKIENFVKTNESQFSLFGWLVKLFSK